MLLFDFNYLTLMHAYEGAEQRQVEERGAQHRVVRKPAVHRHSFAFFFAIDGDKWVEPLPEFTIKIGEAPHYRGFLYREYQQLRIRNKTHPPSRPEDVIHITHYAA